MRLDDQLAEAKTFEAAARCLDAGLNVAIRSNKLDEYVDHCLATAATTQNRFAVPYGFAYAARGVFHNQNSWRGDKSSPGCLDRHAEEKVLSIVSNRRATDNRDNYLQGTIESFLHYSAGRIEQCYTTLAATARHADIFRVIQLDLLGGSCFGRSLPTCNDLDQHFNEDFNFNEVEIALPPPADSRFITILVSFDVIYARAFLDVWLDIAHRLANRGVGIHAHVMLSSGEDQTTLDEILSLSSKAGISLSFEKNVRFKKPYFASSRFNCACQLMDELGTPLFLSDADAYIGAAPHADEKVVSYLERIAEQKQVMAIMPRMYDYAYMPWRHVAANAVFVPQSDTGRVFMARVVKCIRYFWHPEIDRNWWIDQFAIETARLVGLQEEPNRVECVSFPFEERIFATGEQYKWAKLAASQTARPG